MKTKLTIALMLVVAALAGHVVAADAPQTSIKVTKMCCGGCAKKIAAKLYTVPGVTTVQVDLPSKTVIVTPQANVALSPRAIWEAIEGAKDIPVLLAGPHGTFKQKPTF